MSGRRGWSPFLTSSTRDAEQSDYYLGREIEQLERAVREHGVLARRQLGRLVGCRYWGPGRYGAALRAAVRDGRIRRVGRGMYGPAD
ncbi:MAG TPA: hypothetical protein VN213_13235 [Solirubrobacteraceae bacterium]|nr:hypothetical protein [Solirubrobacteraceae bacterium]